MKYLALGLTFFGLVAAYKGWQFNGFEFFVSLKKDKPRVVQDAEQFDQDGNFFTMKMNASNKVVVSFDQTPKGIKTTKILGDRYKHLGSLEYLEL